MKKELKEGMGFICETLEDKERIWQKLTDAGYKVCAKIDEDELKRWKHIFWSTGFDEWHMTNSLSHITNPLNESEFFDEVELKGLEYHLNQLDFNELSNEWIPKAGEWVEVSDMGTIWHKRQFFCTIDRIHLTASGGDSHNLTSSFSEWKHIRQIKPETMTLQEVREALGKPNLIVTQ